MSTLSLRCIAGPSCAASETVDGDRLGAVTTDPGTLCEHCLAKITRCCRHLPRDWAMLHTFMGEHRSVSGEFVRSTPTPGLPIDPTSEALAAAVVELMELAAEMVSAALNADQPTGRRNTAPDFTFEGETKTVSDGSAAWRAEQAVRPTRGQVLEAAVRIVEPQIATLVAVEAQDMLVWRAPRRCATHADAVAAAESELAQALRMPNHSDAAPKEISTYLRKQLRVRRSKTPPLMRTSAARAGMAALHQAYASAANCDHCNGWDADGQAREFATMSGLEVALKLCRLHGDIRAHLGHTKLRHHFDNVPCPAIDRHGVYCGARTVGQDDGSQWVDCSTCGTQWTESEYDLLVSMIVEGKEIELLRWLLAEAYWRLDRLQHGLDNVEGNPDIEKAGAGIAILEGLAQIMDGHQRPEDRATVPALPETAKPKHSDSRWSRDYGDPTPYKRPPRKRTRTSKPVTRPIPVSSLSMLTDTVLGEQSK